MGNIRNLNTAMGLYGRRESLAYKVITPFCGSSCSMNTKTSLFLTSIFAGSTGVQKYRSRKSTAERSSSSRFSTQPVTFDEVQEASRINKNSDDSEGWCEVVGVRNFFLTFFHLFYLLISVVRQRRGRSF